MALLTKLLTGQPQRAHFSHDFIAAAEQGEFFRSGLQPSAGARDFGAIVMMLSALAAAGSLRLRSA